MKIGRKMIKTTLNVIPAKAGISDDLRKKIPAFAGMTMLFFILILSLPANAQDKYDSKDYSPDYCQFTATFPEEPYITKQCEGKGNETCYNLISYTKVFDVKSTVRVEIICNPSSPEMYKAFSEKTMEATVRAMTKDTIIEAYEINSRQGEGYRQTGLLGKGRKGLSETIYIAQLWVAENSIMSVEAELMGEQSAESDQLFADILRTIGFAKEVRQEDK